MNITVIGAGYVGLVTAACFSSKNHKVVVVEKDAGKIEQLLQGKIPFYEPGLDKLVLDGITHKTLSFEKSIDKAVGKDESIIFLCVGTPSHTDGSADLSAVLSVAHDIGSIIKNYTLVINKSTVPVGTAKKVQSIILSELEIRNVMIPFDVASNPEFLKEGSALDDFLNPDRVVVGTSSKTAEKILRDLYAPFLPGMSQLIVMSTESAELTKYAANAMLATRISYMNQMAHLADQCGADIHDVKKGIATDRRIGAHFLNAGVGYGGSCFPKDVRALIHTGREYGIPMTLVEQVNTINQQQRRSFIEVILSYCKENQAFSKKVGIWGLSFKPETDDIREAPSIDVIQALLDYGVEVCAYDPQAVDHFKMMYGNRILFEATADDVLKNADFLIILTEWQEFVDCPMIKFQQLKDKVIFDGRNCFNPVMMHKYGISYISIGRNNVGQELVMASRRLPKEKDVPVITRNPQSSLEV